MLAGEKRIAGELSMNKQEESSAEVSRLTFASSKDQKFMVKGLEAEDMGTYTSVAMVMGTSTFSLN